MSAEIEINVDYSSTPLPNLSLNHVSFVCKSVSKSVRFYEDVLGFDLIKRPSSFKFEGAWLFKNGTGIHLLECNSPEDAPAKKEKINPKDNHISFQCSDLNLMKRKLEEMAIEYVTAVVEEGGVKVDQLFFHDPDGYMVEMCNCENLPVLPLSSATCPRKQMNYSDTSYEKDGSKVRCAGQVETGMMDRLVTNVMDISF